MLGPGDRNATSLHVDIKISLFSLSSLYSLSLMPWGLGGRAGGCGQEDGVEGMGRELKGLRDFGEGLIELLYD